MLVVTLCKSTINFARCRMIKYFMKTMNEIFGYCILRETIHSFVHIALCVAIPKASLRIS